MKKAFITFLFLLLLGHYHAQIAQWIVPPLYDNINFATGADLIVSDSANAKIYWNPNGQRLFASTETVNPFSEGYAVVTNDTSAILGYYDTKGRYTSLASKKIKVANNYPFFTDGYLIIKKKRHYIVDSQGVIDKQKYLRVYPFHNGYAVCRYFQEPKKHKGIVNYLVDKKKVEVPLSYEGKTYSASEVDFISSVNDEHVGFVVIKKMIFVFDGNSRQMSPLYFKGAGDNKRQAKLEEDLSFDDNTPLVIYARCGKNEQITIYFDNQLVPLDIYFNNEKHHYTVNSSTTEKSTVILKSFKEGDLYGLMWKGQQIIPAQFEAVQIFNDEFVYAWQSGKQGLLKVSENAQVRVSINDDRDISFRHQNYQTTVRVDMPPYIDPSKIDIQFDPNSGCVVNKSSKRVSSSTDGNHAEYICTMTIPEAITDITTEFDYPIQITCNNITLLPYQKKVRARRDNYYEVVINDAAKTFDKKTGMLSFPYTVNAERFDGEETVPYEIAATMNSWYLDIQTTAANQGVCTLSASDLEDGENYMFIEVREQGCPPLSFLFSITYKKPTKGTPQKKDFTISTKDILDIKD